MKASELRIGNWVRYKDAYWTNPDEDTKVDSKFIHEFYEDENCFYSDCTYPIPLTEEWLEKFGFEKCNHSGVKNHWVLGNFEVNTDGWLIDYNAHVIACNPPKYVHQLQNLYFALTSEELKLKE